MGYRNGRGNYFFHTIFGDILVSKSLLSEYIGVQIGVYTQNRGIYRNRGTYPEIRGMLQRSVGKLLDFKSLGTAFLDEP